MTAEAGVFAGSDAPHARSRVVEALRDQGLLEHVEPYRHSVGHHDRCGRLLEPLLSEQWFMRMSQLAAPAIAALRDGRVRVVPERFAPMMLEWLENIRDWCLSRQLWWGHRIPVYICRACAHELAAIEPPAACPQCDGPLEQDPDALDTWFSSALWPFATLGWPEETTEIGYFYPTDLMITGRDILYLWIARMVMMGEEFMRREPFADVLVHATVMTAEGRRMSKSLGTGVDPVELLELYGTDATRFALTSLVGDNQDIRFKIDWKEGGAAAASDTDEIARAEQCESARNFCNKVWNISRFALMSMGDAPPTRRALAELKRDEMSLADRWILSRFSATAAAVNDALDRYALGEASWALYHFLWDDLADWYLELAKPRLRKRDSRSDVREPLFAVLEASLRLAHPFLPFLTEEVWQALPRPEGGPESIMVAAYPGPLPELAVPDAERRMATVIEVTRAIRNLRADMKVPLGQVVDVTLSGAGLTEDDRAYVEQSARVRLAATAPAGQAVRAVAAGYEVSMGVAGTVDAGAETGRLVKELAEIDRAMDRVRERLANEQFLARAPEAEVAKQRRIEGDLMERRALVEQRLALFESDREG